MLKLLLFFVLVFYSFSNGYAKPPYKGTVWNFPDLIKPTDPSTFQELIYTGQDHREIYDRRHAPNGWIIKKMFLFNAIYEERIIEIQVNPEYKNESNAYNVAVVYSNIIGQLPNFLLVDLETVWINKGKHSFGGGNRNFLIHTRMGKKAISKGAIEEIFIHEGGHTSLSFTSTEASMSSSIDHSKTQGWEEAVKKDKEYISSYAKKNPRSEDVAESILTWIAVRYRSDRISKKDKEIILNTIPNRLKYFDEQNFDMYPLVPRE